MDVLPPKRTTTIYSISWKDGRVTYYNDAIFFDAQFRLHFSQPDRLIVKGRTHKALKDKSGRLCLEDVTIIQLESN